MFRLKKLIFKTVKLNCTFSKKVVASIKFLHKIGISEFFTTYAKQVTTLIIPSLGSKDLEMLFPFLPQLKELGLRNCSEIEATMYKMWPKCPELKKLYLINIKSNSLSHVWKSCPNLETVKK